MESGYIKLLLFIIFVTLSNSKSIVKNLPGFPGHLPFTLETGYVGVGAENEIQFFYYFVESQRDPAHDLLLLYLTGGPGTSGLFPFLYNVGPLSIRFDSSGWNNFTLELNLNTWTKAANVIFLDLPAGVGFSYATTSGGWRNSDSILSMHTYEFIQKGYLIVSAFTDRFIDQNSRLEFAHRVALISDDIYESTKETCDDNYAYLDTNNALCSYNLQRVDECISNINLANILGKVPDDSADIKIILDAWANDKEVQKTLHVREGTIGVWEKTNETIHYTFEKNDTICYSYDVFSTVDHHKQLISRNCHVLIISGDHDMIIPYVGTEKWIQSLGVPIASPWNPWFVDNQVAGYHMTYATKVYSLTYATVNGAGHSLQLNKPKEASVLVDGWLASYTYISDS